MLSAQYLTDLFLRISARFFCAATLRIKTIIALAQVLLFNFPACNVAGWSDVGSPRKYRPPRIGDIPR